MNYRNFNAHERFMVLENEAMHLEKLQHGKFCIATSHTALPVYFTPDLWNNLRGVREYLQFYIHSYFSFSAEQP